MARLNVTLPDELLARVERELPGLNRSAALQAALGQLLDCRHHVLACATCHDKFDRREVTEAALEGFYREALWRLQDAMARGPGTFEGAARIVKGAAIDAGVGWAEVGPLPRRTRSQREAAIDQAIA